jgi:hypothetical protein
VLVKRAVAAVVAALCMVVAVGAAAPVVRADDPPLTFHVKYLPPQCSCETVIDGWTFDGMPYSPAIRSWLGLPDWVPTVVDTWSWMTTQPWYKPGPPGGSVSVTSTVGGTVDPGGG